MQACHGEIERRLRELLETERRRCSGLGHASGEIVDALEKAALGGGKRLRSKLMLIAWLGAGGKPGDSSVIAAGAALELLHTGCLVHDDIMDISRLRRGSPTVQAAFEGLHRGSSWRGEPAHFGTSSAILVGDLAFYHAMRLMSEVSRDAQRIFYEVGIDVGIGQYLDIRAAAQQPGVGADGRVIAQYKTARYTVEGPLHLAVALLGRLDDLGPGLSAYGRPLGEAYQLRDDLLGAFGDPATTGKPVGDDLRQGKQTRLLAIARESEHALARNGGAATLQRAGEADLTDGEVDALQSLLIHCGARARAEQECDALVRRAVRALEDVGLHPECKVLLRRFAHNLLQSSADAGQASPTHALNRSRQAAS